MTAGSERECGWSPPCTTRSLQWVHRMNDQLRRDLAAIFYEVRYAEEMVEEDGTVQYLTLELTLPMLARTARVNQRLRGDELRTQLTFYPVPDREPDWAALRDAGRYGPLDVDAIEGRWRTRDVSDYFDIATTPDEVDVRWLLDGTQALLNEGAP